MKLLCTKVCHTIPTLNLQQNLSSLFLSSNSFYILLFFIFCLDLQFFMRCFTLLYLQYFLVSFSFYNSFLYITVEASRPPVFIVIIFDFSNIYSCPTNMIAIFHSKSNFNTAMGRYSNMVLIILLLIFFFNKKITYISSVLSFIANTSNFIIKFMICFFSCLNALIFHLIFAILFFLLNVVLTSLTKPSQS